MIIGLYSTFRETQITLTRIKIFQLMARIVTTELRMYLGFFVFLFFPFSLLFFILQTTKYCSCREFMKGETAQISEHVTPFAHLLNYLNGDIKDSSWTAPWGVIIWNRYKWFFCLCAGSENILYHQQWPWKLTTESHDLGILLYFLEISAWLDWKLLACWTQTPGFLFLFTKEQGRF